MGTLALNGAPNGNSTIGNYSRSFAVDFTSTSHLAVTLTNPDLNSGGSATGDPIHSTLLLTAGCYGVANFGAGQGSTLEVDSGAVVDIAGGVGGTLVPGTYDIIQFADNPSTGDTETLLSDDFVVSDISPQGYSYNFIVDPVNGGIDLVVTAVPEPSSLGVLAFGAGAILLRRRRKSRAIRV